METRAEYHRQLRDLAQQVIEVGRAVLDNIGRATDALVDHDLGLVDDVLAADDRIDAFARRLEESAVLVLARQAPVASELSYVVSLLRLAYELERCGDLMVNVARAAHRLDGPIDERARGPLMELAQRCREIFERALGVYASGGDSDLDEADDLVDDAQTRLLSALTDASVDHRTIIALTIAGRCYERVADHAVNLAARSGLVVGAVLTP